MRNCSVRTHTELQTVVRLYLVLPIALVGIVANAVNVLVFLNRRMRNCVINWFLLALSLSDLCLLLCTILFVSMPVVSAIGGGHWLLLVKLQVYFFRFGYPIGIMTQMASVYYTTLVCLHRYIAICHPLRARQLTTKRSAKCAITAAAIFSISINVCRFWETGLTPCVAVQYGGAILTQITISGPSANAVYRIMYSTVGYTLIKSVLPFFVLLALTVLMIRAMCQSKRLHLQQQNIVAINPSYGLVDDGSKQHQNTASSISKARVSKAERRASRSAETTPVKSPQTTALIRVDENLIQLMSADQTCCAGSIDDMKVDPRGFPRPPVMMRPRAASCANANWATSTNRRRRDTPHQLIRESTRVTLRSAKTTSHEGRVTTMLLMIVGVFLLCNCLPFLTNVLEIVLRYQPRMRRNDLRHMFRVCIEIGNLLVAFNSASTIVIYLIFSSKYLEALKAIFGVLSHNNTTDVYYLPATTTVNNTENQALLFKRSTNKNKGKLPFFNMKHTRKRTNV